jgi:hypothetical protein
LRYIVKQFSCLLTTAKFLKYAYISGAVFSGIIIAASIAISIFVMLKKPGTPNKFFIYIVKILTIFEQFLTTIFVLPANFLLTKVYFCNYDQSTSTVPTETNVVNPFGCRTQEYYILSVVTSIILLFNCILIVLNSIFFNDKSPNSTVIWAHLPPSLQMIKALKKLVLLVGFTINTKIKFELPTMIMYCIVCILELYDLYYLVYMPSLLVQVLVMTFEGANIWMAIVPMIGILAWLFIEWRRRKSMFLGGLTKFSNPNEIIQSNYLFSYLYQNKHKKGFGLLFQGVLTNHVRFCKNNKCLCAKISKIVEKNIASSITAQKSLVELMRNGSVCEINNSYIKELGKTNKGDDGIEETEEEQEKTFYAFLREHLQNAISQCGKKAAFYVEQSYINYIHFKNKYMAIYNIDSARSCTYSIIEEYAMFKLK